MLAVILAITAAVLFIFDDCLQENTIPYQENIIKAAYFSGISIGALVLFGGMAGLYDWDIPKSSRIFWRIIYGILFFALTCGSAFMLLQEFRFGAH